VRAAIFNGPRNITPGDRPDAAIGEPSDATVRVVLACVCGSDLLYYRGETPFERRHVALVVDQLLALIGGRGSAGPTHGRPTT